MCNRVSIQELIDQMLTVLVQGTEVPSIGLGTWRVRGAQGRETVTRAINAGYRHIDTAQMYANETDVGEGIRASDVPREEIFVVSKAWSSNLSFESVTASGISSLDKLGTEWIDLYLLHWPNESYPIEEAMEALNILHNQGKVRHFGLSNFSVQQMAAAQAASDTPVFCNQVEHSPFVRHEEILHYCQQNDVLFVAYTPFAHGRIFKDPVIRGIAEHHKKTTAQVTLRWLLQKNNVATIPKSSNPDRLAENLDIFDFELTLEETRQIDDIH